MSESRHILRFACGAASPPFEGSFENWEKGQPYRCDTCRVLVDRAELDDFCDCGPLRRAWEQAERQRSAEASA